MALVKLTDGTGVELSEEKGLALWEAWTGRAEPDRYQEALLEKAQRIYLNWRIAPIDYVIERFEILRSMYQGTEAMALLESRLDNGTIDLQENTNDTVNA